MKSLCFRLAFGLALASLLVGIVLVLIPCLSIPSFAAGNSPPTSRLGAYVDLRSGNLQIVPNAASCISVVSAPVDSNADGWKEAVLKVTLNPGIPGGCRSACVVLEYEGTPVGWTAHIADSPNCDGYGGGNSSDSTSVSEVHITNSRLFVYTGVVGTGLVDNIANENLQLTDGALKICFGDNNASWGNSSGGVSSPYSKLLFQLPDNVPAAFGQPAGNGNSDVYVGLNRIVSGPGGRIGCGLVRAYLSIQ